MRQFLLAALVFFAATPAFAQGMLPQSLPRLSVEGNKIVDPDGKMVSLRGVSLCSVDLHDPLKQIKDITTAPTKWNANVIRLPVNKKMWEMVGPKKYISGWLDPAVKLCNDKGVYCIIDWHEIDDWDKKDVGKDIETFWTIVAPKYAANPNILYEVFNEPVHPSKNTIENWKAYRDVAQRWVDLVRKRAPKTIIIVGSPHWSQQTKFAASAPFKGDNLVYSSHVYPMFKDSMWWWAFGDVAKTVPVMLTEWGWSSLPDAWWGIKGTQEEFGEKLKAYLNERPHIGWTAWSYDPLCGPAMVGKDKDMGAFVKQWLKEVNP
jgi:hypothetical protein